MIRFSRRAFLAAAALFAPAGRLHAVTQSQPGFTLDQFLELSERLLGRSKLDREIAQVYLSALDRDTAIYLATFAQSNGNPTPEQLAAASKIVEWWYTGVYEVRGERRLATHSGALVWSALSMPAPGTCAAPFGSWSKPPASIA